MNAFNVEVVFRIQNIYIAPKLPRIGQFNFGIKSVGIVGVGKCQQ